MRYHFIGIKGSGMASLAEIVADRGDEVTGSDIEKYIFTQKPLEERGIPITTFDEKNIKEGDTVIIGLAFDESNPEVKKALSTPGVKAYWYNDFLGELLTHYTSVSVAGTHGKTTTTGMLAHVLSHVSPTGFLIGDGHGEMPSGAENFILESCEFKRHFLAYHPDYAIITNIELDHVDYYHDIQDYCDAFQSFIQQVKKGIVYFGDDPYLPTFTYPIKAYSYGLSDNNDVRADHVDQRADGMAFDIFFQGKFFGHFDLPFVGYPLLYNSIGVIALGILFDVDAATLETALKTFPGVQRRFIIEENGENIYIDDYAHHPTAVRYMIEAARIKYPDKKVIAIFKPDRYSRIAYFLDDFASALDMADEAYVCDFPANAVREPGVTVTIDDLVSRSKKATLIQEDEAAAKSLALRGPAVYLFMSSKDIYKLKNKVKNFQYRL